MNGDPGTGGTVVVRARLAAGLIALACWQNSGGSGHAVADPIEKASETKTAAAASRPDESERGTRYPHEAVRREEYGAGGRSYWLFEPAGPTPRTAPVVVFNHGWLAVNPAAYGAWISHLARSGHIVIFPRYQSDPLTRPQRFLPNAIDAVNDALQVLETGSARVRPDRSKFAIIGHSAGGNLAVQMAAEAEAAGLPRPRAVIALMPGEVVASRTPSLADVPGDILLIVAVAENDVVVGDARAREIFSETTRIPSSRKRFLFYRSDLHGFPALVADHFLSTGFLDRFDTGEGLLPKLQKQRAEVNAFDRAGLWPMADLTLRAAFTGDSLDALSDGGERFKQLGLWSDGRPVTPPIVTNELDDLPRVFPSNGLRLIRQVVNPAHDAEVKQAASP